MSKGKRNVAFGNDEDFEIEYVAPKSTVQDTENNSAEPKEIVIDSIDARSGSARTEALKGGLNDLARESPETVAAIIKSMFRGDN